MSIQKNIGIAARYAWFAANEARGRSVLYEKLAEQVSRDEAVLEFLATLPKAKQQPNLLFAAVRYLHGVSPSFSSFKDCLLSDRISVRETMMERTTQTNEPARCAAIMPLLASLPGPLSIIEVGASAGLCLLPDKYAYKYNSVAITPNGVANSPTFGCNTDMISEIAYPEIVWRAGLDLNPLDIHNEQEMEWLELLVWPGQDHRAENLRKAIQVARSKPPEVHRGDLLTDLRALIDQAPADSTTVVFHSAVLNYLSSQEERDRFVQTVTEHADHWISNESPFVLPSLAPKVPEDRVGEFVLSLDGKPMAWSHPHGAYLLSIN